MSDSQSDREALNKSRVFVFVLLCLVLATDIYTPLGFAHGFLYLPVLIFAMRLRKVTDFFQLSVLVMTLTGIVLGYFLASKPPEGVSDVSVLVNRMLSAAILVFTYLFLRRFAVMQSRYSEIENREQSQREYLEQFIDAMPVQVWSANTLGEVDFASRSLVEFTGKSREVILADWLNFLHPDDRVRTMKAWSESVSTGQPYQVDFRLLRHDGNFVWFQTQAVAQKDEQGEVKRWLGSSIDIDDLRSLRERSDRLAEQFRHTVESITDAFFTLDQKFRFTYLNEKAAEVLGGTVDEFLGSVIWEKCLIGYDSPFAVQYRKAAETQEKLHFEEFFGSRSLWLEVRVYPSSDGLTVYFSDVTVQRAEREQLKLLNTAVSRLNDIVVITEAKPIDEPGPRAVFVNNAFVEKTGYSYEEAIGASPRILQGPKTDRGELDRIRAALETWQPIRSQLINYTKSGEEFWLEMDLVPLSNEAGCYTHWVAVERDITEQKKLQEQLAVSQKMESIGQLTGGISHDFNNLLTVILGNAELLQEELAGDERLAGLASLICQAAEKGASLTGNLLAFARKQPLAPRVVSVAELLRDMYPILKTSLGERNRLEFEVTDDLWSVYVDPSQLESAILNLAINSNDAMPKGGAVKLFARNYVVDDTDWSQGPDLTPGRYAQITFTDNGEGMPDEVKARIFEPFYTTKSETQGNGLGLSMIYGFLKQSKGSITVYSEVGLGTTFHLYLPCTEEHSDYKVLTPSRALPQDCRGASILVVEDNPDIRALAVNALNQRGFQVFSAVSGDEALKLIETGVRPKLLFTDVVMPGSLSGPDLAQIAQQRIPGLKVILTSGFADLHSFTSVNGESDTLLQKPYRTGELINMVHQVLSGETT